MSKLSCALTTVSVREWISRCQRTAGGRTNGLASARYRLPVPQAANGREHRHRDSLGPFVVPHPEQPPAQEQEVDEHREQYEHDRHRHRCQGDDYRCCPHENLPPVCHRRVRRAGPRSLLRPSRPAPNRLTMTSRSGKSRIEARQHTMLTCQRNPLRRVGSLPQKCCIARNAIVEFLHRPCRKTRRNRE